MTVREFGNAISALLAMKRTMSFMDKSTIEYKRTFNAYKQLLEAVGCNYDGQRQNIR